MPEHIKSCSFCGQSQNQVQRLFTGAGNISICNACLHLCQEILNALPPKQHENTSPQSETTNPKETYNCSFCGKPQDQVQSLVAGPGNYYICNECIDLHRKALEDEYATLHPNPDHNTSSLPETTNLNPPAKKTYNCSFCGKSQYQVQCLIAGPGRNYICNECIELSRKTIEEEGLALLPHTDQNTSTQPETPNPNVLPACSFCGQSQDQVQRLIAGPGGVHICNECVGLLLEIIQEEIEKKKK